MSPKKRRRPGRGRPRPPAPHRSPRGGAQRPVAATTGGGPSDAPDLLLDVREALGARHPLDLLAFVSSLLAAVDPRLADPFDRARGEQPSGPSLSMLVRSFVDVDVPETTALLAVIAELATDEVVARRARRELASRDHALPGWLHDLVPLRGARAVRLSHVLGDGDNVMVEARTANGDPLTAVVYVDHNLGTVAKDAFVLPEGLRGVTDALLDAAGEDPDMRVEALDPADARAWIDDAVEAGAITFPPFETDTWPAARPLVEWIARQLPAGGRGPERREWTGKERGALARRFLASPHGARHDGTDAELLDSLLWYACDHGIGDPLRWSPPRIELLLLDWLPRKVVADAAFLSRAPALLRSLVRFGHAEAGISDALTAEALDAVDRHEPEYLRIIGSPRAQGPAALLEAMGIELDADDPMALFRALGIPDHAEIMRETVAEAVGPDAVADLDATPLPDEPLDLAGLPEDIRGRVGDVAALADACCEELLDVEHRTACRRLLQDVAAAEPDIFRRRGRDDTAAAAVVWIVAKANDTFSQRPGGLTAKALREWFGVGGSPSQRAATLLRALGASEQRFAGLHLRTPRYLVAARRRWLAETRDRYAG